MQQTNQSGENYSVETGDNNQNFFGGVHYHAASQRSATGIPHNLPYGTSKFVGRDADLKRLHEKVQRETKVPISAIAGMGGVGKTELALQYAYCHLDKETYPGGICWLRAGEKQDLSTQIVSFARTALDLLPPDELELDDKVQWCWRHWHEGDVLVIFDDVWNYDESTEQDQKHPKVKPVLPPAESRFRVLLTTRLKLGSPVETIPLEVLTEASALELLHSLVMDERINQQFDKAKRVCGWLGYLPLGLELVGRYLAQSPDTSLTKLEQRLQSKRLEANALKEIAPEMTASRNVVAAFELSWETLNDSGRELAGLLSLFALAEIPWLLVEQCLPDWDEENLEGVRNKQLLSGHLLQRTGVEVYQLHQLLREFFIAKQEQMAGIDAMKQSLCQVLAGIARRMLSSVPTLTQIQEVASKIPHFTEVATTLSSWLASSDLQGLFTGIAFFYEGQVDYAQALHWFQQCCTAVENRLGANHISVAASLSNLGNLHREQGHYREAEPLFLRALSICKQQDNDSSIFTITLNNLAALYRDLGYYKESEKLFLQSISIDEQRLGSDDPSLANTLNNLAMLYRDQGCYNEAEQSLRRSLAIWEQQLSSDHPNIAKGLNNLALLYRDQGLYNEAEPLFYRALAIWEQQLEQDHPNVALNLSNLAGLYQEQGLYNEAEPLLYRALIICEQQFGQDHPNLAIYLNNLAAFYQEQERYSEAEPLLYRALAICEQQLGQNHPNFSTYLSNLAQIYEYQGRYNEAEQLFHRALVMCEQQFGKNHPDVAIWLNNLAESYREQGRYNEAEPLFYRALAIGEQQLGQNHPKVAICLNNLASFYQEQGLYDKIEPLYIRALEISEYCYGKDHLKVVLYLEKLADFYYIQRGYVEAEPLYLRAIQIRETQLGDHLNTATNLDKLAYFYKIQERYEETEPLYIRAIQIREIQLGKDHPDTANSLNSLALLYDSQGRYEESEPLYLKVLQIRKMHLGAEHLDIATSLNNLALLYHTQERYAEVELLLQQVLKIREMQLGHEHPDTVDVRKGLEWVRQTITES